MLTLTTVLFVSSKLAMWMLKESDGNILGCVVSSTLHAQNRISIALVLLIIVVLLSSCHGIGYHIWYIHLISLKHAWMSLDDMHIAHLTKMDSEKLFLAKNTLCRCLDKPVARLWIANCLQACMVEINTVRLVFLSIVVVILLWHWIEKSITVHFTKCVAGQDKQLWAQRVQAVKLVLMIALELVLKWSQCCLNLVLSIFKQPLDESGAYAMFYSCYMAFVDCVWTCVNLSIALLLLGKNT